MGRKKSVGSDVANAETQDVASGTPASNGKERAPRTVQYLIIGIKSGQEAGTVIAIKTTFKRAQKYVSENRALIEQIYSGVLVFKGRPVA